MVAPIHYRNFKLTELSVQKSPNKQITYDILYKGNPLVISSSKVKILEDHDGYLDIELPKDRKKMYDVFHGLDKYIILFATQNSEVLFNKKLSKVEIEERYKKTIQVEYPGEPGYIRVKVPSEVKIFDKSGRSVNKKVDDVVEKDDEIWVNLKIHSLRLSLGTIKCNWCIEQIQLNKIVSDCTIRHDSESESEDEQSEDERSE